MAIEQRRQVSLKKYLSYLICYFGLFSSVADLRKELEAKLHMRRPDLDPGSKRQRSVSNACVPLVLSPLLNNNDQDLSCGSSKFFAPNVFNLRHTSLSGAALNDVFATEPRRSMKNPVDDCGSKPRPPPRPAHLTNDQAISKIF